jgi:hypothetical protein
MRTRILLVSKVTKYLLAGFGVVLLLLLVEWCPWRALVYHRDGKIAQQEPMDTTVCAIVEKPAAFDNTMVRIKGHVNNGMEYSLLYGDGCDDPIWFAYGPNATVPDMNYVILRVPGSRDAQGNKVPPIPVKLVRDSNFDRFEALMNARSEKSEGDWFFSEWVTGTFVGRVDAVSAETHASHENGKRITGADNAGFGHMGLFDAEFVMQSVTSAAAIERARKGTTSLKSPLRHHDYSH